MIQEGHMKDFKCILGDSEILAEQLLWSLSPVCDGDLDDVGAVASISRDRPSVPLIKDTECNSLVVTCKSLPRTYTQYIL